MLISDWSSDVCSSDLFRAPRVGGGYRLIVEPWRVVAALEQFDPTSIEVSDKSTLLPVTRWARRNDVGSVLFSHERLDLMLGMRTGFEERSEEQTSELQSLMCISCAVFCTKKKLNI